MVVESTGFVECDDEEGSVPLWTGAKGFVDIFDYCLTIGDEARGVHGGGPNAAAGWVQKGEIRKLSGGCVGVELRQRLDEVGVVGGIRPVEPEGVCHGCVGDVVLPRVAGFGELLEDGPLVHGACEELGKRTDLG